MFGRFFKMVRWNKDSTQQQLALMLISAGSRTAREAVPVALEIKPSLKNKDGTEPRPPTA